MTRPHSPTNTPGLCGDERGVSQVVGYAAILGLGLVISFGVTASLAGMVVYDIDDIQYQSAKANMNTIAADSIEVVTQAPHRETTVDMVNAELAYGNTVTIVIQAAGGGVDMTGENATSISTRTITYLVHAKESPDVYYRLAFGLVSRESDGGSAIFLERSPQFEATPERALFVLPSMTPHDDSPPSIDVMGNSRQGVILNKQQARAVKRTGLDEDGNLVAMQGNVTVQHAADLEAWAKYFKNARGFTAKDGPDADSTPSFIDDWDGDGDREVRAFFETEQIYIQYADIKVAFADRL